jgi:hypothetical protein
MLIVLAGLSIPLAASSAIGVVTAPGSFRIDRSQAWSNATVFDGTLIETARAGSLLRLGGGLQMRLGSDTRGQVFRERLLLEKGESLVKDTGAYRIEAANLTIAPTSPGSSALVAVDDGKRVKVTAVAGSLQVTAADGALLAKLEAGRSLEFDRQAAGAAPPFAVSGCLSKTEGRYELKDDIAAVMLELRGGELEKHVGQRVEVTGVDGGTRATVRVTSVKRIGGACASTPASPGKPSATQTTGTRTAGHRLSGTTKAIIAGVAVAAVGAGSTLALIGEEQPKPVMSR